MAHALPRGEFEPLNVKRVHRLWKEEKLGRVKRYRKKRTGSSVPVSSEAPNHVWCLDFCHDACLNGTRFKCLSIVDEFTRERLALEAATSLQSLHVQNVLAELFGTRGTAQFLRSDNGRECIARSLAVFLMRSGTQSKFIKPGSSWQNAFVESFHSTLRRDCLDVQVFHNLADAQTKLSVYRRYYNEQRPHSSLGNRPTAAVTLNYSKEEG